jgi:hypothetical protein
LLIFVAPLQLDKDVLSRSFWAQDADLKLSGKAADTKSVILLGLFKEIVCFP